MLRRRPRTRHIVATASSESSDHRRCALGLPLKSDSPTRIFFFRFGRHRSFGRTGNRRARDEHALMIWRLPSTRVRVLLTIAALLGTPGGARGATLPDGSTAEVGRGGNGYPCVESAAKYDLLQAGLLKHRRYMKLRAMQGGIFLERGEHVRIVAHAGAASSPIRVKIESGSDAGKACWLDSDVDEAFVNVRPPR